MNILIINCGSSSIKFSIFDIENNEQVLKSEINIFSTIENELEQISAILKKAGNPPIDAIAHRVIHVSVLRLSHSQIYQRLRRGNEWF